MKANSLYILLFFNLFCFQLSNAQEPNKEGNLNQPAKTKPLPSLKNISSKKDTLAIKKKDTIVKDSIINDSIKKPKKEAIDYVITHNAEDYTVQNAKNKTVTLYNKAHIVYGDIDLKAGKIIINYKKNTVYATGIKDSTKTKYIQRPVFKQGNQQSEQDSILFNFKTKKALVYGVKTVQGGIITYGTKTKQVNDSTIYMRKLRFTTSQKKKPDYYIATNRAKLIPGKKIIVGGSRLVIADVPTPLYLPFAYFPLTKNRASGFIIPSWGENNQQGFFIQNGGYYLAANDYFDLLLTGDIYTNGSWGLNVNTKYYVKYKFSGNLSVRYQNLVNSVIGFNDYSKNTNYNINWSHSQDSKSSPNSRLSASVNLGSSKFYRQSISQMDQSNYMNNTLSSSINYYKKFVGTPFNMNLSFTHSQNSNTEEINMSLPSLVLNMDRLYPFVGKGGVKKNAIQKIGVNYNMRTEYRIRTNDDEFFTATMFKKAKKGVQHNVSANTNFKAFRHFTLTPSANYKDVWYFDRINKRYDPNLMNEATKKKGVVVVDTLGGFARFNEYSASLALSTNMYGTFNFKNKRLKTIRHTFRPSISWSYRPEFAVHHNLQVQKSANPNDIEIYSPFQNGMYSSPSSGISNSIGISVGNVLEAKVANKDPDSDEEDKKITIINNLNFSSSYNMAKDSLRWSSVSFSAGIPIINNKINLNINGSFDPYQKTDKGVQINKFNKAILRLQNITLSTSYGLSNKDFEKEEKEEKPKNNNNPPNILGTEINPVNEFAHKGETEDEKTKNEKEETEKKAKLYNAKVPWNVNFGYSISYNDDGYSKSEVQRHTLDFSGSVELSPKWKVGFQSGYDIKNGAFSYTTLNFDRDLDSWRFNFNWIPFGDRTSYTFFIGVKSSALSDLKWDKNKPPDKRLF